MIREPRSEVPTCNKRFKRPVSNKPAPNWFANHTLNSKSNGSTEVPIWIKWFTNPLWSPDKSNDSRIALRSPDLYQMIHHTHYTTQPKHPPPPKKTYTHPDVWIKWFANPLELPIYIAIYIYFIQIKHPYFHSEDNCFPRRRHPTQIHQQIQVSYLVKHSINMVIWGQCALWSSL